MNKLKDKDLREALNRRETRRTKPEVPADFCDSIMQEIAPKKSRPVLWRWVAAAACLAVIVAIGVKVLPTERSSQPEKKITAMVKEPATVVTSQESGVRRQETGDGRKETGVRRQESGDRRQEIGDRRQESEVRRRETGDSSLIPTSTTPPSRPQLTALIRLPAA